MTDTRSMQLALALLRAWIAEDQEAMGVLVDEEIDGDTFSAVLIVAAGALQHVLGREKALQLIDVQFSLLPTAATP